MYEVTPVYSLVDEAEEQAISGAAQLLPISNRLNSRRAVPVRDLGPEK